MVNKRDAARIAVDVAMSTAAEIAVGDRHPLKNTLVQNAMSSTIYHYALRENVHAAVEGRGARLAAKAGVLMALKALHYWADSMPIRPLALATYGASQAAAGLVEPVALGVLGLQSPRDE